MAFAEKTKNYTIEDNMHYQMGRGQNCLMGRYI